MPAALITAGGAVLGSLIAGNAAQSAANTAAKAQLRAGREAASASAFRPIGMTTRFGTSNFQMGTDKYGNPILVGAGYTASPEIQAYQNRLSALAGGSLGQAEQAAVDAEALFGGGRGLFNLGQQFLATSPQAAREQYIAEQTALINPLRQQEEARLASTVFGRGRAGLSVGATGQPELATLAAARRTQDLQLAANAEQAAQQRIGFGANLFGQGADLFGRGYGLQTQALSPFLAQFGATQSLEQAALQPLELGANLGGRAVNTAGASAILQSGLGAAQAQLQGGLVGPSILASNIGNISNQYLRQQQQNQMFDRLYGTTGGMGAQWYGAGYSPWGGGYSNPYAANAGVNFTGFDVYD